MNRGRLQSAVTLLLVAAAAISLFLWLFYDPTAQFSEFLPGMDNRPAELSTAGAVEIGEYFNAFAAGPIASSGSWPRFRGADFDNISKERVKLADAWPESGPRRLWAIDLGEGHAGPVIADGRVYLLDYDETKRRDVLRCFSFESGAELWQRGYDIYTKRNHGMSRTVPAVKDSFVVTIGPQCQVMCVQSRTGAFKWGIDIAAEYKSEVPLWYTGQCTLIDGAQVILATGGTALIIGVDLTTGQVIWQTPNPDGWKMSHSSVMPMTLLGKRVFVYVAIGGIVGVSAEPEDQGEVLFKTSEWSPSVIAPSPIHLGGGKLFFTAGYGAGSALFQVTKNGGAFQIALLAKYKPTEGLCAEQQTPLLFQGHLFSILPKDAGPQRNQFVCAKADAPQTILWASERDSRFGLGPYLIADNKFFILSDDGELTMAQATTSGYKRLARFKVLDGNDSWAPMAIVNGRLLCRDSRRLVCLDVRAE
jgi:outer membrane protein assembly factor BamB